MDRIYISRQIEQNIEEAADQFPVIVVTGPRQTGKSTLLRHRFPDHTYVTLDDPVVRKICREDPSLFLDNYPPPCIIDEIQYAPEIFPLIRGLTESLAGRAAVFELQGFSMDEYALSDHSLASIYSRIYTGNYPDTLVHNVNRSIFYGSYLQTCLERDIRQIEYVRT